jgi:hypothetical protein
MIHTLRSRITGRTLELELLITAYLLVGLGALLTGTGGVSHERCAKQWRGNRHANPTLLPPQMGATGLPIARYDAVLLFGITKGNMMVCVLSWFWDEATEIKLSLNYLIEKVNKPGMGLAEGTAGWGDIYRALGCAIANTIAPPFL